MGQNEVSQLQVKIRSHHYRSNEVKHHRSKRGQTIAGQNEVKLNKSK